MVSHFIFLKVKKRLHVLKVDIGGALNKFQDYFVQVCKIVQDT